MAFVVVYDACVLYPAPLRDLLLRIAAKGLVRARWTDQILDECFRNILINRPDLSLASLQRTRDLMNRAIVETRDHTEPGRELPGGVEAGGYDPRTCAEPLSLSRSDAACGRVSGTR
jgi:hypothetical protein